MACTCRADNDHIVEPIVKYVLCVFNFLLFCLSLGAIVGGAWLLYQRDTVELTSENIKSIFDLAADIGGYLVAVGILGIIFSLIGVAAALRENVFGLRCYLIFLIGILVLNLVVGIVFLIYSGKITNTISDTLKGGLIRDYFDDDEAKSLLDTLQSKYKCCGIQDYNDWSFNMYFMCNTTTSALACTVPSTCCRNYSSTINQFCSGNVLSDSSQLTKIYENGCSNEIINLAQYGVKVLSGCLIGCTIVLGVNIFLVQYLIILVRKEMALYNSKKSLLSLETEESISYLT